MAKFQVPGGAFKEFVDGEKLIDPGWHSFRITKVEVKPSSKGDSLNYWFSIECTEENYKSRKGLRFLLNEKSFEPDKARYEVIPFILALDDSLDAKSLIEKGIAIDTDNIVGKELKIRVNHEEYNGRMMEKFNAYASINSNV